MRRPLYYLLAFSALSITAFPQSTQRAHTSGLTSAPAIRSLSVGDTPHPQPAAAANATTEPAPTAGPSLIGKKLISGSINEKGSGPLEGVVIATKDGRIVSGSMQDGQYYIEIPAQDSVLVFSLDGYATRVIKLHEDDNECSITLQPADPASSTPADPSSRSTAPFSALGPWRGTFQLRPGVEVPFNFEIRPGKDGTPEAFFRNGSENADGGPVTQTADSFFIALDQYDNELAFPIGEGALTGSLHHQDKKGTPLTVRIEPGNTKRFQENGIKPAADLTGTYDVTFVNDQGTEEKTVGLFKQEGNKLTGTFLRVTGDTRYLEGIVEGNNFYLSSFFGSGPSYYKGSFTSDGHLTGVAASLPSLNTFLAFPTTIVIDRKGRVAEIHTGYSGPATGPYYQEFLKEFNTEIDVLVKG